MNTKQSRRPSESGGDHSAPAELRIDALNNRIRIVEVARESFAALGLDVPMSVIARNAGVGAATLYRRFPTKDELVTEVFADQIRACGLVIDDALADPDPWRAFCTFIRQVSAMQAADRGFTTAFTTAFPESTSYEQERARAVRGVAMLVQRAKDAGKLRPDFVEDDLFLLLMANSAVLTEFPRTLDTTGAALARSHRLVAYLLDSFRADHAHTLPPATPVTPDHLLTPPTGPLPPTT